MTKPALTVLTLGLLAASLAAAPPARRSARKKAARLRVQQWRPRPARPAPQARCDIEVPQLDKRLPFGPGERLGFVVYLAGVYVGRARLEIGERQTRDGFVVYPVHGEASTNSFFKKMSKVQSVQTSWISPDGVMPLRMQSESRSSRGRRVEEVVFDVEHARAEASLAINERRWRGRVQGSQALQDAISIIYFARSRAVRPGSPYCAELYYGRRPWLVRGQVGATEMLSTAAGPFRALPVSGEAVRAGAPPYKRSFKVWLSDDDDRLPLKLVSASALGEIEIRINDFKRGRRLIKDNLASR